jgi:transposase
LFALKQAIVLYDNYGTLLTECDTKLESMLATLVGDDDSDPGKGRRTSNSKNAPQFDVRTYLFRLCGVDPNRINGINPTTALKVIVEVGPDMSRFKSAKHFASWLEPVSGHKDFRR